jgi:hypothetical protein
VPERNVYWLLWQDHRWELRRGDATLSEHASRFDAIYAGAGVARANRPSSLRICRTDGWVEDVLTYEELPPRQGAHMRRPETANGPPGVR